MRHVVTVEDPHPLSMAAAVLLARRLEGAERARWMAFRAAFLAKAREVHGELKCHYCGQGGLVADLPDTATKGDLRRLATLDHVVPRSKGGAEFDEGNVVVACHPCNQKKADNEVDTVLVRG